MSTKSAPLSPTVQATIDAIRHAITDVYASYRRLGLAATQATDWADHARHACTVPASETEPRAAYLLAFETASRRIVAELPSMN